jgi:hypothetical protein
VNTRVLVNTLAKMNKAPAAVDEPIPESMVANNDQILDENLFDSEVPDQNVVFDAEDSLFESHAVEKLYGNIFDVEDSLVHHATAFDVDDSSLVFSQESPLIFTQDTSLNFEQHSQNSLVFTQDVSSLIFEQNTPFSNEQNSSLVFTQETPLAFEQQHDVKNSSPLDLEEQSTEMCFMDDSDPQESDLVGWDEDDQEECFVTGNGSWIQEDTPLIDQDEELSLFQEEQEEQDICVPDLLPVYMLTDADPHGIQIALTYKLGSKVPFPFSKTNSRLWRLILRDYLVHLQNGLV